MLSTLFLNLREHTIAIKGTEFAEDIMPSESLQELKEGESQLLFTCFTGLLVFDTAADFAATGWHTKVKDECKKGYPCGKACISTKKNCINTLEGQAKTYAGWLELQAKKKSKIPLDKFDKTQDTGNKASKTGKTEGVGKVVTLKLDSKPKNISYVAEIKDGKPKKLQPQQTSQREGYSVKTFQLDKDGVYEVVAHDLFSRSERNIDRYFIRVESGKVVDKSSDLDTLSVVAKQITETPTRSMTYKSFEKKFKTSFDKELINQATTRGSIVMKKDRLIQDFVRDNTGITQEAAEAYFDKLEKDKKVFTLMERGDRLVHWIE